MQHVVLGIDVGGTSTKIGLVNREGYILGEATMLTPANTSGVSPQDYVAQLREAAGKLQKKLKVQHQLLAVGVGAPNANARSGAVEFAANLPWQNEVAPIAKLLQRRYPGIPVKLTNDAKAAAMGEMLYGGARGLSDFAVVTLGTGLGCGIVSSGALLYGADGFAGELGHVTVHPGGRECGCGRHGCLETYVSATGLRQTAFEVMAQRYFTAPSLLKKHAFEELSALDIAHFATKGDKLALEVFDRTARMLAQGLATLIALTCPQTIFLYGGLAKAGNLLLEPTRAYLNEAVLKNFCKRDDAGNLLREARTAIMLSELNERSGAVLGAAALAWSEISNLNK